MTGCLSSHCSIRIKNKAVYEGTSTSFEAENTNGIVCWVVYPNFPDPGVSLTITKDDDNVVEMFLDTYAVNRGRLTIFNSTIGPQGSMPYSTAGNYFYWYNDFYCSARACLVVISKSIFSCII